MADATRDHDRFADDLTLYMLGELDHARAEEFRRHLEGCSACQRELQQMNADAALLALSASGPAPPARSRERLLAALQKEGRSAPDTVTSGRRSWVPLAIATALAVIFGAAALLMWTSNMVTRRTLGSYVRQNHRYEEEIKRQQEMLNALNSPEAVRMTLTSAKAKPQPLGRVIYLPKHGAVMFFANYFAPTPGQKVYQLWLLPADGKPPMPCGTFKPDIAGTAGFFMEGMPENVAAKTFAVTMEPEGGSQTPTMPILMTAESRIPTE